MPYHHRIVVGGAVRRRVMMGCGGHPPKGIVFPSSHAPQQSSWRIHVKLGNYAEHQRRLYVDDGHRSNTKSAKWLRKLETDEKTEATISSRLRGIPGYGDDPLEKAEQQTKAKDPKDDATVAKHFVVGHSASKSPGLFASVHAAEDIVDIVQQMEQQQQQQQVEGMSRKKLKAKKHRVSHVYNRALEKLLHLREYETAEWLVQRMMQSKKGIVDNRTYYAAIQLFSIRNKPEQVIRLHEKAQKERRKLTCQVPLCVLRAYGQRGRWPEAYQYFRDLKEDQRVRIHRETYEAMLIVSARAGKRDAVFDLLHEYEAFAGANPPVMGNQVVQACSDSVKYQLALCVAIYMRDSEYPLDGDSVDCLVQNCTIVRNLQFRQATLSLLLSFSPEGEECEDTDER